MMVYLIVTIYGMALLSQICGSSITILSGPDDVSVSIDGYPGGSAYFYCEAYGSAPVEITWWHKGKLVEEGMLSSGPGLFVVSSLRVDHVNAYDDGAYHCVIQAYDVNGTTVSLDVATAQLHTYADQKPDGYPELSFSSSHTVVATGWPLQLSCKARGSSITYKWLKDGMPTTGPIVLYDDKSTGLYQNNTTTSGMFEISRSEKSDSGEYVCIAYNDIGFIMSPPATVVVKDCQPGQSFDVIGSQSVTDGNIDNTAYYGTSTCVDKCQEECLALDKCKAISTRKRWYGCKCYLFDKPLTPSDMEVGKQGTTANRQCILE